MPIQQPSSERVVIPGPAGELQALVEIPPGSDARHIAVVCHPHPLFGGTLENKVVYTLARAFEELGAPAIRFNFRGVGASKGVYDDGVGETQDALAVIEYGRRRWPGAQLWLAGFSFGGAVAIAAEGHARPARLVVAAPAIMRLDKLDVSGVVSRSCPWLIVQGDADEVLDANAVLEWARRVTPAPRVEVLAGGSHFFHGRLLELREAVLAFMRDDRSA
ncbi:MAG TPA: alpha/beta family hydrolase [Steroidobacteraceae bacterium]|nr:alpha/beta family hydrolase [Steroidobacteraceae bacterium]